MTNTNINSIGARLVGVDDPTRDDHAATKGYVDAHGGGGSVSVTDGSTTVTGLTELDFTSGATVTDAGGGVAQVAIAGGGSQTLAEILTTSGDTGGNPITDGANSSLTLDPDTTVTLESDLDIGVHATVQDINVTADSGNINIVTDADNGGSIGINAGSAASLISNFGATTINANGGAVAVNAKTTITLTSGSETGAGGFRMLADGSSWWKLSEPADGALVAGRFAFWLDPTNGAAKLKIKAKTLDGTVVSGEIALAP